MTTTAIKLISGVTLVGNACLAAYIFKLETKRDELKSSAAEADRDMEMFQETRAELVAIAARSTDVFRRASVAWRDSTAVDEQVRVNAFLDIMEWLQSVNKLPNETFARADMLVKDNFDRYSTIYANAQNEYSDQITQNAANIKEYKPYLLMTHQDARKIERRANLMRALFHLITIAILVLALFDPSPAGSQEG